MSEKKTLWKTYLQINCKRRKNQIDFSIRNNWKLRKTLLSEFLFVGQTFSGSQNSLLLCFAFQVLCNDRRSR